MTDPVGMKPTTDPTENARRLQAFLSNLPSAQQDYVRLASVLLGREPNEAPMVHITFDNMDNPPRENIGNLTNLDDQRLAVACGIDPTTWAILDEDQRIARMETALTKLSSPLKRTGRPRKGETDKDAQVIAALARHHQYEPGGSIGNFDPATVRGLAKRGSGFSVATVTRFLKSKFGESGHKAYAAACRSRRIGPLLAKWNGDQCQNHAELRDDD